MAGVRTNGRSRGKVDGGRRGAITPVLLAGGGGSRLWPLSRASSPKQLLKLNGSHTLLQQTVLRLAEPSLFRAPTLIGNVQHRDMLREQLAELGLGETRIVLEPTGRGTAAAAAIAALLGVDDDPDSLLLLCPSDHHISDSTVFRRAVADGVEPARHGRFVLFGVHPTSAATGYGYIRPGPALDKAKSIRIVEAFAEKPDAARAEEYVLAGMLWNSGIFLVAASTLLAELERRAPDIVSACREAMARAVRDAGLLALNLASFETCRSVSLDVEIIEQLSDAAVVPLNAGWADLGSWSSLWQAADKDSSGNRFVGNALGPSSDGCYVQSEGPLVVALGVHDLVVVATPDAVLVTTRNGDQAVRAIPELPTVREHEAALKTRA